VVLEIVVEPNAEKTCSSPHHSCGLPAGTIIQLEPARDRCGAQYFDWAPEAEERSTVQSMT
jgi:hypothetical protein